MWKGQSLSPSGFREIGEEGERREEELRGVRKRYPMRIDRAQLPRLHKAAHRPERDTALAANPLSGNIAFISQSGAFGRALIEWGIR